LSKHNVEKRKIEEQLPDFERFLSLEEIENHEKITVTKISFSRGTKIAFWFLRIYITVMAILVIIGYTRV
jgi:hypothetical protein